MPNKQQTIEYLDSTGKRLKLYDYSSDLVAADIKNAQKDSASAINEEYQIIDSVFTLAENSTVEKTAMTRQRFERGRGYVVKTMYYRNNTNTPTYDLEKLSEENMN